MIVEWLKLRGYRPFWLLLAAYPLLLVGATLLGLRSEAFILEHVARKSMAAAMVIGRSPFVFPEVWHSLTWLAGFFHFLPALLILLTVTNEFQFRTHRQNLLDGWSRARFFLYKLAFVTLVSAFTTSTVAATALGVGFAKGYFEWGGLEYLGLFFVQSLVYGTFSLLLGFLIQRGLLALATFLVYSTVLERFGAWWLGRAGHYAPLGAANDLIDFPLATVRKAAAKLTEGTPSWEVLLGASVLWCLLLTGLAWARFRRADL